uniref:RRP15-like protein n=1 Tax=Dermatophagoides pteronyssinus TaxID=6956 RepID=A0A6P6Y8V7_DERPT|nr:RRP15-like protein [Dermatophagoides pteronyssinus]
MTNTNPAFAFVVNSILNKNKNLKILSKAKKENTSSLSNDNEQTTDNDIDFVDSQGRPMKKEDQNQNRQKRQAKDNTIQRKTNHPNVQTWISKPLDEDREKERNLTLIATKGVVQLFNVVREKQRILKHKLEEAGSSESKRTKVLTEFSEKEMQDERITKTNLKKAKNNPGSKKKWPVLADDFMTGAKLKDWNEDSDND